MKHLKLSDYKIKKLIAFMIDDVTLEVIARNLDINIKTVLYYRYIIFHSLKNYQENLKISGVIVIDETFISIRENPINMLDQMVRVLEVSHLTSYV